ncbi:MAG: type II toxin-antitoxin system Phd/YefM family antitoxin [Actinobacteria bacterium]|nr:type II toxin-antitoxin system Phd/YefM family antitoxin [Actinomycetota bacterium]
MDVAVSELRAHLSEWLSRVHQGDGVVVTHRGIPVAGLLGMEATPALQRLTAEGVNRRGGPPTAPLTLTLITVTWE